MADRLLSQLNQSKTTAADKPLWQVIKQLIDKIHTLEDLTGSNSNTNITNITQVLQYLNSDGDGGGDGESTPIPGQQGAKGDTGSTGPTGPPFPAFIVLDADLPEEPLPIPGLQGIQGATGSAGPAGSQAVGFVIYEGAELDEVPMMMPSSSVSGGSGGPWTLIEARSCTGNPNEDFLNLNSYSEIMVFCRAIVKSVSGTINLRVSSDNGATFLSTSGDYFSYPTTGAPTSTTSIGLHITSSTSSRSGSAIIRGFNIATEKPVQSSDGLNYGITITTAFNAIRIFPSAGGNLNTGTIYVFGRV